MLGKGEGVLVDRTGNVYVDVNSKRVRKRIRNWLLIAFATVFLLVLTLVQIYFHIRWIEFGVLTASQCVIFIIAVVFFMKTRKSLKELENDARRT